MTNEPDQRMNRFILEAAENLLRKNGEMAREIAELRGKLDNIGHQAQLIDGGNYKEAAARIHRLATEGEPIEPVR